MARLFQQHRHQQKGKHMRIFTEISQKEGWLFVKMTYKGWYASEKWEMRYFSLKNDSLEYNHRKQHVYNGYFPYIEI